MKNRHSGKNLIFLMMGFFWLLAGQNLMANGKSTLVFGITPWDKPEKLTAMYVPLMEHLEKKLNIKTKFVVTQDYDGLTDAILKKTIDIALYSPKAYVAATKKVKGLRYLVTSMTVDDSGNVVDNYKGLIIARKDANIKSFSDLKGKRFGFTNKTSSSGYAYPESRLRANNIDVNSYFSKVLFLKKHERVIGALASGSIDAGATWDGAYANGVEKYGEKFNVIDSVPIPNDPYCAAPHVPKGLVDKLQEVLLSLKKDSEVMKAMNKNGFPDVGYSLRNDKFYDVVRGLSN